MEGLGSRLHTQLVLSKINITSTEEADYHCNPILEYRFTLLSIPFSLLHRAKNSVEHFPVRYDGQEFSFGFGRFSSVSELLEHFEHKPVIGGESGVCESVDTCTCICVLAGCTHSGT